VWRRLLNKLCVTPYQRQLLWPMGQWLVTPAQMRRSWPSGSTPHIQKFCLPTMRMEPSQHIPDSCSAMTPWPVEHRTLQCLQVEFQCKQEREKAPSPLPGPHWPWHTLWPHHLQPPSWNSYPHSICGRGPCSTPVNFWFPITKCSTLCAQNPFCLLVMGEQPAPKHPLAGS